MNMLRRYKRHIIVWAVYFTFWTGFAVLNYGSGFWPALAVTACWFLGQAGIGYYTIYILIPRWFNARHYVRFSILFLACLLAGSAFIAAGMIAIVRNTQPNVPLSFRSLFPYAVLSDFFSTIAFVAFKLIRDKIRTDRSTRLLEKEKTESELRFLRSQMNPHFLFNALNSIYILIRKEPEFAATTLIKFADMLRYQLYECNVDDIPIEKEIGYLDNYIGLEQLRKGDAIRTDYLVSGNTRNFRIAPLLIIPFVENAFKYVSSSPDRSNYVRVNLDYREERFELIVENSVEDYGAPPEEKWGGVGLENVRRRLELIYNGRHTLDIRTDGKIYTVVLSIQIP